MKVIIKKAEKKKIRLLHYRINKTNNKNNNNKFNRNQAKLKIKKEKLL